MSQAHLKELFDSWARWVHKGGLLPGGSSIMAKMIEGKGFIQFGSGGGRALSPDCIEAKIECALMGLSQTNPQAVALFRLEHGALRQKGFDPQQTQLRKAHALGISVRTYRRRLAVCTNHIITYLANEKRSKHFD